MGVSMGEAAVAAEEGAESGDEGPEEVGVQVEDVRVFRRGQRWERRFLRK